MKVLGSTQSEKAPAETSITLPLSSETLVAPERRLSQAFTHEAFRGSQFPPFSSLDRPPKKSLGFFLGNEAPEPGQERQYLELALGQQTRQVFFFSLPSALSSERRPFLHPPPFTSPEGTGLLKRGRRSAG